MSTQHCPICSTQVQPSARYPEYICSDCTSRAQNADGRRLRFTIGSDGTFIAHYLDWSGKETGEMTNEHICSIDGVLCQADEAHMGGIVLIPVK